MVEREIESKYLDESKKIKIYFPETFSDLYKYNICLMFDGDDYFQMGRIATYSDKLHEEYELTNTIFVGIHYKDAKDRRRKYPPDGSEHEAFTKFVVKEVVPLLDQELPTYHMGKSRILMGDSLAGTFSLLTALKYPNTFGKAILQSPFIDDTALNAAREAK
jgi:enterochelin esterase-like enzyme